MNVQRSYEICSSVIADSPNCSQLQDQLKMPPELVAQLADAEAAADIDRPKLKGVMRSAEPSGSQQPAQIQATQPRIFIKVSTHTHTLNKSEGSTT